MSLLLCRGVRKSFRTERALDGVDLQLERGEVMAVVGPSGSGKSTLLHCVAGLLAPDEGTVLLDGTEVWSLDDEGRTRLRREWIGMGYQSGYLVDELTCLDNVILPALAGGTGRAEARSRAQSLLDELGVSNQSSKRPHELSGGQRQRVAIARALVNRPELMLADEPTGSVDQATGHAVLDLLIGTTERGGALLIVTHDSSVAARADRVLELVDGKVTAGSRA